MTRNLLPVLNCHTDLHTPVVAGFKGSFPIFKVISYTFLPCYILRQAFALRTGAKDAKKPVIMGIPGISEFPM